MTQRRLWMMLFIVSIIVTLIGLGFAVYNYYAFDKPFFDHDYKRVTGSIFPLCNHGGGQFIGIKQEIR